MNKTIDITKASNLCISCGICIGNCPNSCIELKYADKQFYPEIHTSNCVSCGICYEVCPVNQLGEYSGEQNISEYLIGEYKKIICAQSKSQEILNKSTSGGFITQLVSTLLNKKVYKSAFLIEGYSYKNQLKAKRFISYQELGNTSKSRYLMVSHEDTIRHIIAHPEEKVIVVGTGCAVQGILNTIRMQNLNRDNYLIIGLFCDKTMNQGVVGYFEQHPCGEGKNLQNLHFRTKDAGGWPGNVRLKYTDGSFFDLPNTERMKVKDYFVPERCLYCLDKLNRYCDIAVGDNYIPSNSDVKGVNSCIIRTDVGFKAWKLCCDLFLFHEDSVQALINSQHLEQKIKNHNFACMKGIFPEIKKSKDYYNALKKRKIGLGKNVYIKINRDIKKRNLLRKLKKCLNGSKLKNTISLVP